MKSGLIRILGVSAALALPAGGLAMLTTNPASAAATNAVHATIASIGTMTCPGSSGSLGAKPNTALACTTSGLLTLFGKVTGTLHGFASTNVPAVTATASIVLTGTSIGSCTITFLTPITLTTGPGADGSTYSGHVTMHKGRNYSVTGGSLCTTTLPKAITTHTVVLTVN